MNYEGFRKLTYNSSDQKNAELMAPVFRNIPKDIPVIGTHVWPAQAALHGGMKYVVNAIPDNWPMALHFAEGSVHTVQTHYAYQGYRILNGMMGDKVLEPMPADSLVYTGHYIDHELVSNIEADCEARIARKENGKLLRGISSNQICIATAADKRRVYCKVEGEAKPTSEKTLEIFKDHIRKRSTLIHDGDASHNELVNALRLKQEIHYSADTKGLDDTDNPLDRINDVHSLLKIFLDSHSGFLREYLQDYLNLFVLISNPPYNKLEKADLFLERALRTRASLKYRDFYKCDKTKEDASGYDE
jgi:hypothetical protein